MTLAPELPRSLQWLNAPATTLHEQRGRIVAEARARVARLRDQDASMRRDLERWLPGDQREALRGIEANLETIGARLRTLASDAS